VRPFPDLVEPRNILVVDDEIDFGKILAATLTKLGHTVSTATGGREASAEIARQKFDLVITDLVMPDKEGIELIQELATVSPNTRIIAMSGGGVNASKSYLKIAVHMGAKAILSKPFSTAELMTAIDQALA
jgi:DNA-binding NtrC family response regulator